MPFSGKALEELIRGANSMSESAARSGAASGMQENQDAEKLRQLILGEQLKEKQKQVETAAGKTEFNELQSRFPTRELKTPGGFQLGAPPIGKDTTAKSMQDLSKLGRKEQEGLTKYMDSIDTADTALKQGTALGDKATAVALARLTEGQGQRILQSVVKEMGAQPDVYGNTEKALNWLTSSSDPTMATQKRAAVQKFVDAHKQLAGNMLKGQQEQFGAESGYIGAGIPQEQREGYGRARYQGLSNRSKAWEDATKTIQPQTSPTPAQPQITPQPPSMMDKLRGLFGTEQAPSPMQTSPQPDKRALLEQLRKSQGQ